MNNTNSEKWVNLFEETIKNPDNIEILQKIEIGYNSTVYLTSVDAKHFAVKMYDKRYNGTNVCIKEKNNIIKARKSIPKAVPSVVFYSKHTENEFDRDILVMEKAMGVPLNKKVFNEQVFNELINILKKLHNTRPDNRLQMNEIERISDCERIILQFLKEDEIITEDRASNHIDALKNYYLEKKNIFNLCKTVIHGDLWWDNILVDNEKIIIVDWLESSEQDYCRDLAQLKIGTLNELLEYSKSQHFFQKILNEYKEEFKDETIFERIKYYVSLMYLEESFYLPFKYFPWEIKYKEDAENFKKRFIDYFEKSEWFFKRDQDS